MAGLVFVISLLLVGGLLFLGASLLLGRGETQPPAEPERSPVQLPESRAVVADDVRALRISVAVRGYRMTEVDWLLDQLASVLDDRDAEIAALRAQLPGVQRPVDQQDTDPGGLPILEDGPGSDEERRADA